MLVLANSLLSSIIASKSNSKSSDLSCSSDNANCLASCLSKSAGVLYPSPLRPLDKAIYFSGPKVDISPCVPIPFWFVSSNTFFCTLGTKLWMGINLNPDTLGKPWIGIKIQDNELGVFIPNVNRGSPADKSGLMKKDIIIAFNNEEVKNIEDLDRIKFKHEIGEEVSLKIIRNNKVIEKKLILGDMPRD